MLEGSTYFYYFQNCFFAAYSFVTIILLIGTLFIPVKYKQEVFNWLYVLNTFVAWIYCLNLLLYGIEMFNAWYDQNSYEFYAFSVPNTYIPWKYQLAFSIILYLTALLFFIRKLRINRIYILFFLLLLNREFITVQLTDLYRDYLPSSWTTYYPESLLEKISKRAICLLVVVAVYWICRKRNKLPYPSLVFK